MQGEGIYLREVIDRAVLDVEIVAIIRKIKGCATHGIISLDQDDLNDLRARDAVEAGEQCRLVDDLCKLTDLLSKFDTIFVCVEDCVEDVFNG